MPIPSDLRLAGQALDAAGIQVAVPNIQFIQNSRPTDGFSDVDALGQNADIITGNPWTGGLGMPMNVEFQSTQDARNRLNDLRQIGVYK